MKRMELLRNSLNFIYIYFKMLMINITFYTWLSTKNLVRKFANIHLTVFISLYISLFWLWHYFHSNMPFLKSSIPQFEVERIQTLSKKEEGIFACHVQYFCYSLMVMIHKYSNSRMLPELQAWPRNAIIFTVCYFRILSIQEAAHICTI